MRRICVVGLAVAVAVVALLLTMPHASAQPVAGAYYAGEISNCVEPPCGTVDFGVSEDGSQVEDFAAYDVPGVGCRYLGAQPYPGGLLIDPVDYSFGPGDLEWYQVSGGFPSEGTAEGTLRLAMGEPLCDTTVVDWTAAVGQEPVGGIAVLPDVSDSAAGDYVALAGLAAAALAALTAGAWWARRRWLS